MRGCDIAVIGAGPAGMDGAIRAKESVARVAVLDDNPTAGGQIWRGGERTQTGAQARRWLEKFKSVDQFAITNCRVVSAEVDPLKLLLETSDRTEIVRPETIVLATGAREIFLPFAGWT